MKKNLHQQQTSKTIIESRGKEWTNDFPAATEGKVKTDI